MVEKEHLELIMQGAEVWNSWRHKNEEKKIDLSGVDLNHAELHHFNLSNTNLNGANLECSNLCRATLYRSELKNAKLLRADLIDAELSGADLAGANLTSANLTDANLTDANLTDADLSYTKFDNANLYNVYFGGAKLYYTDFWNAQLLRAHFQNVYLYYARFNCANLNNSDFSGANLENVSLNGATLTYANLCNTNITNTKFFNAVLVNTNIENAIIKNCNVYGISAWNLQGNPKEQADLIITSEGEPVITVDNLQIAQFIYLLLNNNNVRDVIDTITSKVVLILGRFTSERKVLLDGIRNKLRDFNLTPILFDFDKPRSKDLTGTIETIARMARFIIADITDPRSIPHELATIARDLRTTPIQLIQLKSSKSYTMVNDYYSSYKWVLKPFEYEDNTSLLNSLKDVIAPANNMAEEFRKK